MNTLKGVVQTTKGAQGISGLVVLAFGKSPQELPAESLAFSSRSLGSVETDFKGRFKIEFEVAENETFTDVTIGIIGPEIDKEETDKKVATDLVKLAATNSKNLNVLFITAPRPFGLNTTESYTIRIDNEKLAEAGVVLPEATTVGSRLALREKTRLEEIAETEKAVGEAITDRVKKQRVLENEFQEIFLPQFIKEIQGKKAVHNPDYKFIVSAEEEKSPGALSRLSIKDGIKSIQAERDASNPTARFGKRNRRRTRFFFSQAQLDALDNATTEDGTIPPGGFELIGDAELKSILGMDALIEENGIPTSLSKEEVLFDAFLNETLEESCARQFLDEDLDNGGEGDSDPSTPGDSEQPEPADEESILRKLTLVTEDIDSPLKTLTGRDGGDGVVQSIQDFAIPVGPADEPRVFDFSTLQVAFQDVWQSVFDTRLEPLARSLYTQVNKVLVNQEAGETIFVPDELSNYQSIKAAVATVKTATNGTAATSLSRKNGEDFGEDDNFIDKDEDGFSPNEQGQLRDPDDNDPNNPISKNTNNTGSTTQSPSEEVLDEGDKSDPNATPEELINQLDDILREPYEFSAFGADRRSKAINFGLLVGYRHVMTPVTYQVGDLVKSITLAPGESREYTTKTVITRKRAEKEMVKNSSIRKDELNETSRAETELVRKALAKTNFSLTTEGTYNLGFTEGNTTTNAGRDAESQSDEVKKNFREAILKSSQEIRQERAIDINFEESSTFEETMTGKIENPNNELTITYLFFELQRRFRVNETIHKATPVILIAQDIPAPNEITNAFLIEHGWIFQRALLDDSFEMALDYVCTSLIGDRLEVISLQQTLRDHRAQVGKLKTQLVSLEEQAGRRYEALLGAVRERIGQESEEENDGFFSDLKESFFGGGQTTGSSRLREEAARDAEQRAAQKAKEMATFLQRAVNALNEATENYNRANRRFNNMLLQVAKLRVHIKQNIIYYMQAIWAHEVNDQRFLRLYQAPVPQFTPRADEETLYKRLHEKSSVSRVHVIDKDLEENGTSKEAEFRFGVDFEILPSIDVLPSEHDRPLVDVADLNNLLGFMGNYLIFPMKESNALTDLMLNPYIDEGLRLLDPHDPGNITRPQFAEYICKLREELSDEDFKEIQDALKARYRDLLLSSEYAGDEIVVPSGALYIEAMPGNRPLLENFKLAHRAFDMVSAQEEAREQALENLRLAARLVDGELGDPDVDAQYNFNGDTGGIVAEKPGSDDVDN